MQAVDLTDTIERALAHHDLGATTIDAFFGGLKQQAHVAADVIAVVSQDRCGPEQDRRVAIVPALVRPSVDGGTVRLPSDVVLLPFPFTALSASKRRPVLILKESNAQGDFLAVQITSQTRYLPALSLVAADFELGGLPKESIVRPDKVFTLNESLIVGGSGS